MNLLLLFALILVSIQIKAQILDIEEAIKQKLITVEARVNDSPINGYAQSSFSGDCIDLTVKNNSSVYREVIIKPGQFLLPADTNKQRMMSTIPFVYKLNPGQSITQRITAFCSQARKSGPTEETVFRIKNKASGNLLMLANYLAEKKYKSAQAQQAVWIVSDHEPVNYLATSESEAKDLFSFLTVKLGIKPVEQPKLQPTAMPDWIRTVHIDMEYEIERTYTMRLVIVNEKNEILKVLVDNEKQNAGVYKYNTDIVLTVPYQDTIDRYCIVRYFRNDVMMRESRFKLKRLD